MSADVERDARQASEPITPPLILVIDDSESTANALSAMLRGAHYRTEVAYRGTQGLEKAREQSFNAAIVDIHLPDLSGLLVSQKLREILGPDKPIVVLSGDTSMTTLNSLPHVGATYFFSKPVDTQQLLDRLKEWLMPASPT